LRTEVDSWYASTLTRGAEGLDRRAFTVDEIERLTSAGILDRDEGFELIAGEIVPTSPELRRHAVMKRRLASWFTRRVESPREVGSGVSVQLATDALLQPDVVVLEGVGRGKFLSVGSALLVIEVADLTLHRDLGSKARDYAQAGLGELWVVDLEARVTHVRRDLSAAGYTATPPVPFELPITPRFDARLTLRIADLED